MKNYFDGVKKNFGFGCMRLPMKDGEVDTERFSEMIKIFFENGFNYFDTAHGYISGKSEKAIKTCLTDVYPRESYILTDKLTENLFEKEEDILPMFAHQLECCGVEYFDFYLMHAQNARNFEKYKRCRAYETAFELKKQGKVKHVGLSFHDSAAVLDKILTEYPEVEVVQIQFNYLDYENSRAESKLCLETCRKHGKPVIVMEPVKGGTLAAIPKVARDVFAALGDASPASYAIRFAAGFDGMFMVLSGMSSVAQMNDNVGFMKDFAPLDEKETEAVFKVRDILRNKDVVQCTSCRYCTDGCPKKILIPDIFTAMNSLSLDGVNDGSYEGLTVNNGKASDCIKCGKCEKVCPQKLPIRDLLVKAAEVFGK